MKFHKGMKCINFFGGPGSGKSTMASTIFSLLKKQGVNVELVTEVAKELSYEKRTNLLEYQDYILARQIRKMTIPYGHVDAIVTDSPILMSHVYAGDSYPECFHRWVDHAYGCFENIDIFLERVVPFQKEGRHHNEEEAAIISANIYNYLYGRNFESKLISKGHEAAVPEIMEFIMKHLGEVQ